MATHRSRVRLRAWTRSKEGLSVMSDIKRFKTHLKRLCMGPGRGGDGVGVEGGLGVREGQCWQCWGVRE